MTKDTICQSFVRHGTNWWFVSTINRESSAVLGPRMYAETMVWVWNNETDTRVPGVVHSDADRDGRISTHQAVVEKIYKSGAFWENEDTQ